jgi:hypothetical protein
MSEFNFDGLGIEELYKFRNGYHRYGAIEKQLKRLKNRKHSLLKELTNKVEALDDSFYVIDES